MILIVIDLRWMYLGHRCMSCDLVHCNSKNQNEHKTCLELLLVKLEKKLKVVILLWELS